MSWEEVAVFAVPLALTVWAYFEVRRAARKVRRAVEPTRVRGLAARGRLSKASAQRSELARDVLLARQTYEAARQAGRPVKSVAPTLAALEKLAKSLDADLRLRQADPAEVARLRSAARSLTEACRPDPRQLDDVEDAAELARLTAEARRQLSSG